MLAPTSTLSSTQGIPSIFVSGSDGEVKALVDDQGLPLAVAMSVPKNKAMAQLLIEEMSRLEEELMDDPASCDAHDGSSEYSTGYDDGISSTVNAGTSASCGTDDEDDFDFDTGQGAIRINSDGEVVFGSLDESSGSVVLEECCSGHEEVPDTPIKTEGVSTIHDADAAKPAEKVDTFNPSLLGPGLWDWQLPRKVRKAKKPPLRSILKK
ncbi:hypothetical protein CERSUDRAFT_108847, partial [Gelatoporia subvermispora B]